MIVEVHLTTVKVDLQKEGGRGGTKKAGGK